MLKVIVITKTGEGGGGLQRNTNSSKPTGGGGGGGDHKSKKASLEMCCCGHLVCVWFSRKEQSIEIQMDWHYNIFHIVLTHVAHRAHSASNHLSLRNLDSQAKVRYSNMPMVIQ